MPRERGALFCARYTRWLRAGGGEQRVMRSVASRCRHVRRLPSRFAGNVATRARCHVVVMLRHAVCYARHKTMAAIYQRQYGRMIYSARCAHAARGVLPLIVIVAGVLRCYAVNARAVMRRERLSFALLLASLALSHAAMSLRVIVRALSGTAYRGYQERGQARASRGVHNGDTLYEEQVTCRWC